METLEERNKGPGDDSWVPSDASIGGASVSSCSSFDSGDESEGLVGEIRLSNLPSSRRFQVFQGSDPTPSTTGHRRLLSGVLMYFAVVAIASRWIPIEFRTPCLPVFVSPPTATNSKMSEAVPFLPSLSTHNGAGKEATEIALTVDRDQNRMLSLQKVSMGLGCAVLERLGVLQKHPVMLLELAVLVVARVVASAAASSSGLSLVVASLPRKRLAASLARVCKGLAAHSRIWRRLQKGIVGAWNFARRSYKHRSRISPLSDVTWYIDSGSSGKSHPRRNEATIRDPSQTGRASN